MCGFLSKLYDKFRHGHKEPQGVPEASGRVGSGAGRPIKAKRDYSM
jgi:hypothetical protein